jgi:hypothetical protein
MEAYTTESQEEPHDAADEQVPEKSDLYGGGRKDV